LWQSKPVQKTFALYLWNKIPHDDLHPLTLASITPLAAVLILLANRSCVPMIAPPISETGWLLLSLVRCRSGGYKMFDPFFASSSFPE
jgi:hypothetical protein